MYLKMLATTMLMSLNDNRLTRGMMPTAVGPLETEMNSILSAREAYLSAPANKKMHDFVAAFAKCNHYSMVAYPVGMHHDHF